MDNLTLIATTAFGIEALTAREIENLGYTDKSVENGRVTFRGDSLAVARANMFLRTADRVLIKMGEFKATTFTQLFDGVKALPWEDILPANACFPVTGRSVRSGLFSVSDCQAITKKAIVDRLKSKYKYVGDILPEDGPTYKIEVALLNDMASLTVDTTGAGLNKRGYRRIAGEAPLKETMASALLDLTFWKYGRTLVDPLCGSGTFPIEAAMKALKIAPGLKRDFLYQTWSNFDSTVYDRAREEALDLMIRPSGKIEIYGSDLDPKAIDLAKLHAQEAGVGEYITLKQMNVNDFYSKEKFGFIVTNPPYGERLLDKQAAQRLYKDMGRVYARLDNWSCYVITSDKDFEKCFGRHADKRRKLYNGRLECQYYQFLSKEKPPREPRPERTEN
jgi:putative N6-adenine-specific DNA methylase